jgi:mannose-6-phosphate isomerase-like protein (cupin superfamily)
MNFRRSLPEIRCLSSVSSRTATSCYRDCMKPLALTLLLAGFALPAGDPPGFYLWKSAELKGFSKTLAPQMNDKKVATQSIASYGNYSFMVAHREGSGEAEYHATQADVFVVQSGEATLVVGGELVDGKTSAPNEMRAASIKGGTEKKLAAGDVVTIPAKVAHQVKLDAGKQFTYFVVKVTQP